MAIRVACRDCRQKLRVPEGLGGGQVTCPCCGKAVAVPLPNSSPEEARARAAAAAAPSSAGHAVGRAAGDLEHAPPATRFGVVALVLGLAAVVVACVPFLGYASFALSGLGLLLGLWGLIHSFGRETGVPKGRAGGPPAVSIGGRAQTYPLAGSLVCLVALLLALLPLLLQRR
jgi:hypothetical protein